jgi:cytochrome c oxidase subunit 3
MSNHDLAAHVAHQFDSAEQQKHSSLLGIWIFLLTEIMFFGAVFVAYGVYRSRFPDAFALGTHQLNLDLGGLNTIILMTSSFTMTLAVLAARANKKVQIVNWLIVSIVLGIVFLGIKAVEYKAKFDHHLVPGHNFMFDAHHLANGNEHFANIAATINPGNLKMFFGFYFVMTGLHAIHMIIGIGILFFILNMARKGKFNSAYYNPLECTGLYWHFVDMVWIFLFPALYLLGRHG